MIGLQRNRTVATVKPKYCDPERTTNGVDLIQGFLGGANKFYSDGFWKLSKDLLKEESHGKCAFCESPTSASYYGDVEHFRPKQRQMYWWLAYCLDNYVYSCRICNGAKSDTFPVQGAPLAAPNIPGNPTPNQLETISSGMTPDPLDNGQLGTFDADCLAEDAILPNPYQVDPWPLFKWEVFDSIDEVNITHRNVADEPVITQVIDILRLNRDELRGQRYQTYTLLEGWRDILDIPGIPQQAVDHAKTNMQKMMDGRAEYCGMARYFVQVEWGLNIPIP